MDVEDKADGTKKLWFRPNILQKGLGLVLIPLLMQGVLFAQFYALLNKADELNRQEARQSLILEEMNKLTELFTAGWGSILQQALDRNQVKVIDPVVYKARTTAGIKRLKELSPSPAFTQVMESTEQVAANQFNLLRQLEQETAPDESSLVTFTKYKLIKDNLRPYMHQILVIDQQMSSERAHLNMLQSEVNGHREAVKSAIIFGVIADILVTLGLVLFLLKNIRDRLKMLVLNARILPTNEKLPTHVGGHDELAYLDQILHQASAELQKAAEYRKAVMETMSHDLRSPVQSALITAELLERNFESLPESEEVSRSARHVDSLKRNLSRVVGLVEDHLTIDKLESGTASLEIISFNLRAAVEEAIDALQAQAGLKSIELVNKVEPILVEADRGRIIQVIANFLGNAIKFSPRSAPIFVSSQNLGHSVKVMVLDDGPGMDNEAQQLVYERFQQNVSDGKSRQGYGLGLAICKLLIAHHNGRVGVTSAPGKGSTFWFILPIDYEGE
jgi:signal transduction histidine kinase